MRADRLLSLLMLLQTRGKLSARELAAELEVSERTIYRDVDALGVAGVPIYAEPGRNGGYALVDRYRTQLTGFSEGEVRALFMLSIPAPLADLGISQSLKAALLKISAALPAARRDDEARVRRRFYLDSTWWEFDAGPVPHLRTLHQAVWQDRRVLLTYQPPFAVEIEQCADPYGLVAKAGEWHLVFLSTGRIRAQRVADFIDVRVLAENFERPEGFALESFWKTWCAARAEDRVRFCVRVRVAAEAVPHLPFYLGERVKAPLAHAGPPDAEGWLTLTLHFEHFEAARSHLLALGRAVEVLEPESLRLSLLDYARQIVALCTSASPEEDEYADS